MLRCPILALWHRQNVRLMLEEFMDVSGLGKRFLNVKVVLLFYREIDLYNGNLSLNNTEVQMVMNKKSLDFKRVIF